MKKIAGSIIVMLAVLAFSVSAPAEIRSEGISVSPFVGGFLFESNQSLKHEWDYGIRLGYDFTKNLAAEAVFNYVNTRYEPGGPSNSANVYNYRLEGLYHFMPEKRLVPFVAIGAGAQTIDYNNNPPDNKTRSVIDYGVGIKYFITDWLALRADIRHVLAFDSVYNNLEYNLGLTFYFGGRKAAPVALKEEAAPAPAAVKEEEPAPMPPPPAGKEPEPAPMPPPPAEEMKKAPEAEATVEQQMVKTGRATLNVEFDFNKAIVKPKYHDEIKKVADVLVKHPELKIVVEGHTDDIGGKRYNLALSQRRADAIKSILVNKYKIDSCRITAKGFGSSMPIASNATPEGRQKNRRVEAAVDYIVTK